MLPGIRINRTSRTRFTTTTVVCCVQAARSGRTSGWPTDRQLPSYGFTHQMVNHSQHFRDPATGVCTNHVEAYWSAVKRRFRRMFVTAKTMVPSYLDEHMWRECHGCTGHMALAAVNAASHCRTLHCPVMACTPRVLGTLGTQTLTLSYIPIGDIPHIVTLRSSKSLLFSVH